MKAKLYTIYDQVAQVYKTPFFMLSEPVVRRECDNLVNDPTSQIHHNPADFVLFELGEFDDSNATLVVNEAPRLILKFHELPRQVDIESITGRPNEK